MFHRSSRKDATLSVLRHNVKSLVFLLIVSSIAGAVSWYNLALDILHNPTPWLFGNDFFAYYLAALAFVHGGDMYNVPLNTYTPLNIGSNFAPFLYPPPAIYLFVPFTYVSFDQARVIVAVIYVATLLLSVLLIVRILSSYRVRVSTLTSLLIVAALLFFEPIVLTMAELSVNIVVLFFITLFYYFLFVKRRPGASGIALGIGAIIKIIPLVLVLLGFLHKRSKRLIVATLATIAALCVAAVYFQGLLPFQEFIRAFLNFETTRLLTTKDVVLAAPVWDANISVTVAIVKTLTVLELDVNRGLLLLDVVKLALIAAVWLYLYKISRVEKDATKLKEWEVLSFTALLVSLLFVASNVESYYTTFLVLSFILLVFVVPLTSGEKVVLWVVLGLFAARTAILSVFWYIGGIAKIIAYIVEPQTVAYVLLFVLLFYVLRDRTKRGYWNVPAEASHTPVP
ncbi:MAG: glycosyltransferase family 87 protein [Halobacteriota archaeon]